jgi:hypothetical protein
VAENRLGQVEAYITVREDLSESSTAADGVLSRERSGFYLCWYATLGLHYPIRSISIKPSVGKKHIAFFSSTTRMSPAAGRLYSFTPLTTKIKLVWYAFPVYNFLEALIARIFHGSLIP